MEIVLEELKLEGGITALGLQVPVTLAVSVNVGTDVWELPDIEVQTISSYLPSLLRGTRLPMESGGQFSISLLRRGCAVEPDALVADVSVSIDTLQHELQTTCINLEWDTRRKMWVSAATSASSASKVTTGGDSAGGGIAVIGCPRLHLSHRILSSELPSRGKLVSLPLLPCLMTSAEGGSLPRHQLEVLAEALLSGRLSEIALQAYMDCDQGVGGFLTWDSGQVQEFIAAMMHEFGLRLPGEGDAHLIFTRFAGEDGVCLDSRDCICLSETLARHILADQAPELLRPATPPATALAGKPETLGSQRENDQKQFSSSFAATLLPYSIPIAQLAVPGFDPHGWLQCSAVPSGLGEHTVLEVLNFFLDGMAEQLGLTRKSHIVEASESQVGASVARLDDDWLSVSDLVSTASPGATRTRSRNHSELDLDSPAVRTTKVLDTTMGCESMLSVPALDVALPCGNGASDAKSREEAIAEAVFTRTKELESKLEEMESSAVRHKAAMTICECRVQELSVALSQRDEDHAQSKKRCENLHLTLRRSEEAMQLNEQTCEDLRQASRLATVETESLRGRLEGAERQSELAERRLDQLRSDLAQSRDMLEVAERERLKSPSSPQSVLEGFGMGRDSEKAGVALYCLRSTIRRVLLAAGECPIVADASNSEVTELIDALKRHFAWLWRALRSLWDAHALLGDVLAEVARTPLAVASLAASGEPPWPEAVAVPRAREVEHLLETLKIRSTSRQSVMAAHAPQGSALSFHHVPTMRYQSVSGSRGREVEVATLAGIVSELEAQKAQLQERSCLSVDSSIVESTNGPSGMKHGRQSPAVPIVVESMSPRQAILRNASAMSCHSQSSPRASLHASRERMAPPARSCVVAPALQSVRSLPALLDASSRSLSPTPLPRHVQSTKQLPSAREVERAALRAAVAQRDTQIQELENALTGAETRRTTSSRPRSLSPPILRRDGPARSPPNLPVAQPLPLSSHIGVCSVAPMASFPPQLGAVAVETRGPADPRNTMSPRIIPPPFIGK